MKLIFEENLTQGMYFAKRLDGTVVLRSKDKNFIHASILFHEIQMLDTQLNICDCDTNIPKINEFKEELANLWNKIELLTGKSRLEWEK